MNDLWQQFLQLHQNQRLPHAILLVGADGELFAKKVARHLLAQEIKGEQLFDSPDGHPDLMWLAPEGKAEMIKIDAIRGVSEFLTQTAQQSGYRVVVIPSADRMNIASANALLKSLEEPGANTLLLLLTDLPHLLLPTIRSRCQRWTLPQTEATESPEQSEFALSLLNRQDPLALAAKYSTLPLTQTVDWLIVAAQQQIRQHPNPGAFAYLDRCYEVKTMLNRQINLNPQLALEDLLIGWNKIYC
jgi:hypothetical protein